jgi:phosphoribosyl 1,2-cyclic phosphodiesterase
MRLRFTVLGSGSAGNASFLEADGFGLLLDAGLGPRQLSKRLAVAGAQWKDVHAVVLTHVHSDHWNERTFAHLQRLRIPVYCHPSHQEPLAAYGWEFARLQAEGLVRSYKPDAELELGTLRCRPLPLRHDGGATFGFRFVGSNGSSNDAWTLAYAADLGSWSLELARSLADVDILALEFNHDVDMEYASGRSPQLIARVLGDDGHLSNEQAAALLQEVVQLSEPGRLRHVVQLHLSRECNHRELALAAARSVLVDEHASIQVHTALQHQAGPSLALGIATAELLIPAPTPPHVRGPTRSRSSRKVTSSQMWLPGWER